MTWNWMEEPPYEPEDQEKLLEQKIKNLMDEGLTREQAVIEHAKRLVRIHTAVAEMTRSFF